MKMKTRIISKPVYRALPLLLTAFSCLSCALNPGATQPRMRETLDRRAEAWVDAMKRLSGNRSEDLKVIKGFIEPCAFTEKTVVQWYPAIKEYYAKWEAGTATNVSIDEGGGMGTVTYKYVYRSPGGGKETLVVVTEWLSIDGVWYRSIEDFGWEKGIGNQAGTQTH